MRSFPIESAQESAAVASLKQDHAGRTSGDGLRCPDDIVEHPPTTTGLVNVAEKRFLKLQKPLHDEGLRGFVLEKPH